MVPITIQFWGLLMLLWHGARVALFFALLVFASNSQAETATSFGEVIGVRGTVFRIHDGARVPLSKGASVFVTDVIEAGDDGKAQLLLRSGSIISVGEKGRIVLAEFPSTDNQFTTKIDMQQGAIRLFVTHSQAGGHFEVESETAVAAVRGTDWLVEVNSEETAVAVLSGVVAVRSKASVGGEVLLDKMGDGTDVLRGAAPSKTKTWGAKRLQKTIERASFD